MSEFLPAGAGAPAAFAIPHFPGFSMCRSGYSLIEVTVALGILLVLAATATPSLLAARDDARARSAADHVSSLLHLARLEAVKRHVNVALRFEAEGTDFAFALFADGNGNGVRSADIDDGLDEPLRPRERLAQHFTGVRFALEQGVPLIDGDDASTGDGVRVGRSRMVSFSPVGTSTSGTLYLLGRGRRQFAVRVLGPTGRIRSFEYHFVDGTWRPR